MKLFPAILIFLLSSAPSGIAALADDLAGKLVKLDPASDELRPFELPASQSPKYYMIYFSAYWCPPCRKRTPTLVSFYNETKAEHPEFEFILVSGDRSKEAMDKYIRWAEMPWPALAWEQRDSIAAISELDPRGIPFLAMLDSNGRLLGASELGGFHVGIPKLINGLQDKLGIDPYDLDERHGKTSLFALFAYAVAGGIALILILRRVFRKKPA